MTTTLGKESSGSTFFLLPDFCSFRRGETRSARFEAAARLSCSGVRSSPKGNVGQWQYYRWPARRLRSLSKAQLKRLTGDLGGGGGGTPLKKLERLL